MVLLGFSTAAPDLSLCSSGLLTTSVWLPDVYLVRSDDVPLFLRFAFCHRNRKYAKLLVQMPSTFPLQKWVRFLRLINPFCGS